MRQLEAGLRRDWAGEDWLGVSDGEGMRDTLQAWRGWRASAAGVAQAQARRSRRGARARPAKGADVAASHQLLLHDSGQLLLHDPKR